VIIHDILDSILLIKILYAAASIQGVFLALMLWRTTVNQPANRLLGTLLLLLSFHLLLIGFDERAFFLQFPHLSRISWIIGALYGPLIFLFVQRITNTRLNAVYQLLLFLPFIILFFVLLPYYLQPAEVKRNYLDAFEVARADDFGWINQAVSILHVAFAVSNLAYYLWWERKQSEEFSSLESIRVKWLRQFLVFQLVITLFGVSVFFARIAGLTVLADFYRYHFIGVVMLFYWLSYRALTQPVLFGITGVQVSANPVEPEIESEKKSAREPSDDDYLTRVFQAVKEELVSKKLYLNNNLTLTELATLTGYPRNLVSQAINSQSAGNFFDFINQYRIDEFLQQSKNPAKKHLSQLGIALESGFSSKASFYAVFKKKTGMTPAEYLLQQEKSATTV